MKLLETFHSLIGSWRGVFSQPRTFERVRRLTFGLITCLRVHLTSTAIRASGRQLPTTAFARGPPGNRASCLKWCWTICLSYCHRRKRRCLPPLTTPF